ncbi:MAG: N-formylglutamate amidohydrolase [Hyphomicrobiales bacterium]
MALFRENSSSSSAAHFDPPFEVLQNGPINKPVVFNSPHSGNTYPLHFVEGSKLDSHALRRSEDALVDILFQPVVTLGMPLIKVNFPRAYLDVNREPYELDPSMFRQQLPDYVNTSSMRVAGGLGTIPRVVSETEEIYRELLDFEEAEDRIQNLYVPYHGRLEGLLNECRARFGEVLLVDCHSMPSSVNPAFSHETDNRRPDFVLGDRYGSTCNGAITDTFEALLIDAGYTVARNKPYAGGHITQHYGRPAHNRHAMQVEVNRALYMDETTLLAHEGFAQLQDKLAEIIEHFVSQLPSILNPGSIAAE